MVPVSTFTVTERKIRALIFSIYSLPVCLRVSWEWLIVHSVLICGALTDIYKKINTLVRMHEAKSAANTPSLQYTFYNKESFRSNKNINKYNYHKPVST